MIEKISCTMYVWGAGVMALSQSIQANLLGLPAWSYLLAHTSALVLTTFLIWRARPLANPDNT